jgi:antimicrobial peptide system SdpA family protein
MLRVSGSGEMTPIRLDEPEPETSASGRRRRGAGPGRALASAVVGWVLVALFVVEAAAPANPITLPFERLVRADRFLPQGWSFFTRDPREADHTPYVRVGGRWASAAPKPQREHAFGLSRRSRAQGAELGLLVNGLAERDWVQCPGRVAACFDRLGAARRIHNPAPAPTLCGDVAFVRRPPLAWAWRDWAGSTEMPAEVVRLVARC